MGDGWFHTGDAAVLHPDGYAEIRDRIKDVIISGGENISSLEVEGVLLRHPAARPLLVAGWRNDFLDVYMATEPGLLDPRRAVPSPALA
jgi:acyl-CoA synthetase (AMP-forming)/AMP-acid ligase II